MTLPELYQALVSTGLPVAYDHFDDTEDNPAPAPPFIVYLFSGSNDLIADNRNYVDVGNFQVELYTAKKDLLREKLVQDLLKSLELPYSKSEIWLESERMYQIIYEIQIIGG